MKRRVSATGSAQSRFSPIGNVIAELKKVVWPTRREAIHLTTLVVIVAIVVGLLLGAIDLGFSRLVNEVLLK